MFRIGKRFSFETAHSLPNHDGPCRALHGHSYHVEFEIEGTDLEVGTSHPKRGMLLDFRDLKEVVKPIIDNLDHNGPLQDRMQEYYDTEGTGSVATSTAEALARMLYELVKTKVPGNAILHRVRVEETDTTWADYIHNDCPLGKVT